MEAALRNEKRIRKTLETVIFVILKLNKIKYNSPMNKLLIILFFMVFAYLVKAQPIAPPEKQWIPVEELTDEFDGSVLDETKWIDYHPYWSGRAPSVFKKENVSVSDGFLKLKSTVANYEQQGNWVNASCVSSKTKAMKPGYYSEARIKCPTLSMTGAYWFQGSYSEIDVIENFGAPTAPSYAGHETHMKTNLHYYKDGWENDISTPWESDILEPACDMDFFTYGVWWKDAETVIFYLDGKEVHTSKTGGPFNENMYMFFDMETFTWGIGLPTIESLDDSTKNMQYVDWVRTYKMEYKPESIPVTGVSFSPDTIRLNTRGETRILTPDISPSDATNQNVSWDSDNTGVAPVKPNGEIKAIRAGTATITCTTEDANKTGICVVIVDFSTGLNSIKQKENNKVKIFPNPITGASFNVQVDGEFKSFIIKIADLSGKVLFQKTSSEKLVNINRNIFNSEGFYLVSVGSSDFEYIQKISCY